MGHSSFFADAVDAVLRELGELMRHLQPDEVKPAVGLLCSGARIVPAGAGRSGLALQMGALRLAELRLPVYAAPGGLPAVVGAGDLLLIASYDGDAPAPLEQAEHARKLGAAVLAITTGSGSRLAAAASARITLVAGGGAKQAKRALFDQACLLVLDAIADGVAHAGRQAASQAGERSAEFD